MKSKIVLLGSTGSIGSTTCKCIRRLADCFELAAISTNTNVERAATIAAEFNVSTICVGSKAAAEKIKPLVKPSIRILSGVSGLLELVENTEFDILVNALVGAVGFKPTVTALRKNKRVALANKESLVIGGEYINQLLGQGFGELIPVDSEHSAILQCLVGADRSTIETITITASGGPLRTTDQSQFPFITPQQALNHPVWSMGHKITIDSATLMNKGFEVIEAHFLFALPYQQLEVVIHPQSIVHSLVTFHDGAVLAQCGLPDMELPIQYSLTYPKRMALTARRLDLSTIGTLTFEKPDLQRFPCLRLCLECGHQGGTAPVVLNAANEIAVQLFLEKRIPFTRIASLIEDALGRHNNQMQQSVELIEEIDRQTRTATVVAAQRMA